jgi:pimeloyl-ACP methyl ester carboxylesterase
VLVDALTEDAIDKFITHDEGKVGSNCDDAKLNMSSMVETISWPGCGDIKSIDDFDKCTGTCIQTATMREIDDFNTQHPGMKVSYVSRTGAGENGVALEQVNLTGWWLPAPGHNSNTPRIVVQHGHTSNSNQFRQLFVAFQLRKLGYSVLVNNLRDHCYSDDSDASVVEWGHAYPYDVLGAWDYLRSDPDKVLGGALDDGKVGILGFSMGALLTTTAFGIEGNVPAVWVDGPPLSPESAFRFGSFHHVRDNYLPNAWLAQKATDIIIPPVWENVVAEALKKGVDISEYTPGKVLPAGPETKRKIMVTANIHDTTVNIADGRELIEMLEALPSRYQVSDLTFTELCNGKDHCIDHLAEADRYSAEMCKFWSDVFGENKDCAKPESCNTRTARTCHPDWWKLSWCSGWRGETFCDEGTCRCKEGYCTKDGEVCEKQ